MVKKIFFISIILLINGITNTTLTNLVVTIPQFCIILFYVITGKINNAVFWHFIFFVTSYTYHGDMYGYSDELEIISYNYAKLKFLGPISYSHIISLLLLVIVNHKNKPRSNKIGLFHDFYKLLILFIVTGFGIGLIGMAFSNYYIEGFVIYGSYILILFIHANILIKMIDTPLRKEFSEIIIPILAFAPIVSFLIRQIYPEMIDSTAISLFSVLLLPALLFQKKGTWLNITGLLFLVLNMVEFRTSGKQILFLLIIVTLTFLLSFSKSVKRYFPYRAKLIRVVMFSFIVTIPTIVVIMSQTYGGSAYIVSKTHQVQTLLNFISFKGGLETIAESPYVRVTSLINILYEGLQNPVKLLFGKGYGGYFEDYFNYFSHINLYQNAFSDKSIASGHFYTGHDTMVTVPMFNGLIGLFLLLRFVWKSIKFSKNNFLILSSVPFLLLTFYFDTLIGVTGVVLLYIGSLNLRNIKLMDND